MRLIDADALINQWATVPDKLVDGAGENKWVADMVMGIQGHFLEGIIKSIEDAPTIDAVEVVRCKDCKWYSIYEAKKDGTPDKRYSPSVCLRGIYAKRRDPDWFCDDGERREG